MTNRTEGRVKIAPRPGSRRTDYRSLAAQQRRADEALLRRAEEARRREEEEARQRRQEQVRRTLGAGSADPRSGPDPLQIRCGVERAEFERAVAANERPLLPECFDR